VSEETGNDFAASQGLTYVETSAKTGYNVEDIFEKST
jgi:hypothetical protein